MVIRRLVILGSATGSVGDITVVMQWILRIGVKLIIQVDVIGFAKTIFYVYYLFHGLTKINKSILS